MRAPVFFRLTESMYLPTSMFASPHTTLAERVGAGNSECTRSLSSSRDRDRRPPLQRRQKRHSMAPSREMILLAQGQDGERRNPGSRPRARRANPWYRPKRLAWLAPLHGPSQPRIQSVSQAVSDDVEGEDQ